ncbi:MAG: hypothetical protein ACTHML_05865 [Ginsengibacter sp.]
MIDLLKSREALFKKAEEMSNDSCVHNSLIPIIRIGKIYLKGSLLRIDGRSSGKGLHQAAIVVYPVVKDFGRIVRPHNYEMEEQRKGNSGDPAIKFQQKNAELILRIIKVNRLRNGIQVYNHRLLHMYPLKKIWQNILIIENSFYFYALIFLMMALPYYPDHKI